ncbi:MAG: hypothetical protein QXX41_08530 [Nitrososphaerota archaeon]
MPTLHFDRINKVITVLAPDTEITIQELYNAIRDWEDDPENMSEAKVCDATGKDPLGAGLYTAITLILRGWKLKFEDRTEPTACIVRGGNLLATDEYGNFVYPIAPSANVTVTITQSTAASLLAEWTQEDINYVKSQVSYIPPTLPEVPTMDQLNQAHGSGSWEGATPSQIWSHPSRTLSSREVPERGEEIASEETLRLIQEQIKKVKVVSVGQYLESTLSP